MPLEVGGAALRQAQALRLEVEGKTGGRGQLAAGSIKSEVGGHQRSALIL